MNVTIEEYALLHQLAQGDHDPLPLHADRISTGYDIHAPWAIREVQDWRARHPPDCRCEKAERQARRFAA